MFYLLLVNSINPKTNLIEFMGSPMCRIDICAFTNSNRKHVDSYIRELIADDVVINVKGKNKDLYYINPRWAKDSETSYEELIWLLDLFNIPPNKHELVVLVESKFDNEIFLSHEIKNALK